MYAGKSIHVGILVQDTGEVYGAERATLDLARGLGGQGGSLVAYGPSFCSRGLGMCGIFVAASPFIGLS